MQRRRDRKRDEEPEGRYSNFFKVGFNSFEFLLDFGQMYGNGADEVLHTRIVTGPAYAKAFAHLLTDSLAAYERSCGPIRELDSLASPHQSNETGG